MHEPILNEMESYLHSGAGSSEFERHLSACAACRAELAELEQAALLVRELRAPEAVEPAPGFYARVMNRIESDQAPSIWALFFGPFGHRLAYASLALLLLIGVVIAQQESPEMEMASSPEMALASEEEPLRVDVNVDQHRDRVLVQLASFGQ
jgi:anti-sigma factor RsiW